MAPRKNILVTGGAGYIGSQVVKQLHLAGYHPISIDNLYSGKAESVIYGTFIEGDIGKREDLDHIFKTHSIEAVIHLAAYIEVGESVLNPSKYYQNNVVNTLCLLNAMRDHGIHSFIFSSSAAIFGSPKTIDPIKEEDPKAPINPYGESKLMVERILKDYEKAYNLSFVSLRYFNAAGGDPDGEIKNYKTKVSNLIPVLLKNIKNDNFPTVIYGSDYPTEDGTCLRDYIHVADLAEAHVKALQYLLSGGKSSYYNLGTGSGVSVKQVFATTEKILKIKIHKKYVSRRLGDPAVLVADGSKAFKELDWSPKYSLEDMIQHAWSALPTYTNFG